MSRLQPLAALGLLAACGATVSAQEGPAVDPVQPEFDAAAFAAPVPNPWFPLVPGTVQRYRGTNAEGEVESGTVTVMGPGPEILGVPTIEVLDEVMVDDALVESTHDFYANDAQGNTWYLGEDVTNYEYDDEGRRIATNSESAWRAGVNGALPGISVPADPVPGSPATFQENAPADEAMDWARTEAVGLSIEGPAGTFPDVLKTFESSVTEPESQGYKYYARGIGLIREEEVAFPAGSIEMTVDLQP